MVFARALRRGLDHVPGDEVKTSKEVNTLNKTYQVFPKAQHAIRCNRLVPNVCRYFSEKHVFFVYQLINSKPESMAARM